MVPNSAADVKALGGKEQIMDLHERGWIMYNGTDIQKEREPMRFTNRDFPDDPNFDPAAAGYRQLKEPVSMTRAGQIILPCLFVMVLAVQLVAWATGFDFTLAFTLRGMLWWIVAAVVNTLLHEFAHTLAYPGGPFSERVVYSMSMRSKVFCAHYLGDMGRGRTLFALLAPYIIITPICLGLLFLFPACRFWYSLATLNAIASCVDALNFLMVMRHAPRNAVLRNHGPHTYWREGTAPDSLGM